RTRIQPPARIGASVQGGPMRSGVWSMAAAIVLASACGGGSGDRASTEAPGAERSAAAPAAARPTGPLLYVTNERAGTVTIIDTQSQDVVTTVALGKRPRGIAVSPDRSRVFVALSGSPIAGPGVDEKTLPPPDKGADGIGVVDTASHKLLQV